MNNISRRDRMAARLDALIASRGSASLASETGEIDVVITTNEINDRHGTGVLVKRILRGRRNLLSIRLQDDWAQQDIGEWDMRLPQTGLDRAAAYRKVLEALSGRRVRSVLCVPFLVDDLLAAIAIQDIFGTRVCAYVMDDQNIAIGHVPDSLMREFLEKSSLRLATHPELKLAYERKYGLPFFLLPAVAPDGLIPREPVEPRGAGSRGALIGSFWDQCWFDKLCAALEPTGYTVDWFGNHRSPWLEFSGEKLKSAGIEVRGLLPEDRLAGELRTYPFAIVPTGALEENEGHRFLASLSLPGRIIFTAAVSRTPILVVGSERTCASRFVKHFGIGETAPYESGALKAAMDGMRDEHRQREMRERAARIGPSFSDRGVVEWLERSIELGRAADARFEDAFAGYCIES